MKTLFWTSAPTGFPGAGSAGLRPFGAAPAGTALPGCGSTRLRAPEAFTAPYRGTGLPFGGQVAGNAVLGSAVFGGQAFGRTPAAVDVATSYAVASEPAQHKHDVITPNDATLGIHSSRRPPS